jgi:hypothetical protein
MALDDLEQADRLLGLFGEITYLDLDGHEVDRNEGRGRSPEKVSQQDRWRALTSMRRYMADRQHARVFIGGAQESYQGRVPGLIEEAQIALSRDQPIYLAGGFGGATMDIVRALNIDDGSWALGVAGAQPPGYDVIEQYARRTGWHGLRNNGLTDEEIRWLAVSHRPSDIAALVASGLGRLSQRHR